MDYEPTYHCIGCMDGGWSRRMCGESLREPETRRMHCGRTKPHSQPHSWVERCVCYETNPKFRARVWPQEQAS